MAGEAVVITTPASSLWEVPASVSTHRPRLPQVLELLLVLVLVVMVVLVTGLAHTTSRATPPALSSVPLSPPHHPHPHHQRLLLLLLLLILHPPQLLQLLRRQWRSIP